ncbi:MAG: hypothetical protein DRI36_00220 [Caldiserica bacterium]|nr:MAG: hypothetical protein DRI36_00220 [Caldisericota bacterium]
MKRKFEPETVFLFMLLLFTLSLGIIFNFKLERVKKESSIKRILKTPEIKVYGEEEEEEGEEFSISIEEEG